MTYTPFEREMLKTQQRTNELLELLVMAHQPMKVVTGMPSTAEIDETVQKVQEGYMSVADAAQLLGVSGFARPMAPPTEEERASRFAARAAEVGLSPEKAEQVSARVKTNLDQLIELATPPKRRRVKDAPQA